jgi:hypothetical protein
LDSGRGSGEPGASVLDMSSDPSNPINGLDLVIPKGLIIGNATMNKNNSIERFGDYLTSYQKR